MHKLPDLAMGPDGVMDLSNPDCRGCKFYAKTLKACKRFPPVFTSSLPQADARGQVVGMSPGGWAFPPAALRCGEYLPES